MLQRFVAHDGSVTAIDSSMSQCNSTIISCSLDCIVKFWRLLDGTKLRTVAFPCPITGIALDQTMAEFFAAGSDGFIYKGLINVGSKIHVNQGHECTRWAQKHERDRIFSDASETKNLISASEDGMGGAEQQLKDSLELEDVLRWPKRTGRAIDMLESAISAYEKLWSSFSRKPRRVLVARKLANKA
ncbi:putative leucine-rich repeat containing protein [Hibiscus syriacus]|uniref:Leucine-rich repeat containing protein n=1 Tax=Hibiscus syriacus TaxID=106335 RepID=A0A6A3AVM8_HIBSY|nr:putative leucine-rich repeat containing protein [Hibiscus syriacus]